MTRLTFAILSMLWCLHCQADESVTAALVTSEQILKNHPFSKMTGEEIREKMRESQRDTITIQLEAYSEPESVKYIAKFVHDLFVALVAEGFTDEQALEIVKSIGLPNRR